MKPNDWNTESLYIILQVNTVEEELVHISRPERFSVKYQAANLRIN
jgi:hypothetical protein